MAKKRDILEAKKMMSQEPEEVREAKVEQKADKPEKAQEPSRERKPKAETPAKKLASKKKAASEAVQEVQSDIPVEELVSDIDQLSKEIDEIQEAIKDTVEAFSTERARREEAERTYREAKAIADDAEKKEKELTERTDSLRKKAEAKLEQLKKAEEAAKAAKAKAEEKAKLQAEGPEPIMPIVSQKSKNDRRDLAEGPVKVYKYWSAEEKGWKITPNIKRAKQIGGELWLTIWVWYKNGEIDHVMDSDELAELAENDY